MGVVVIDDGESEVATDVDPDSPSGSVVYEPETPVGFSIPPPGYAGVDSPALPSLAVVPPVPPGWGVAPPDPVPVLPPVPPSLLAPPNFWAPDFCHRTLTGCIGLPAPGYDFVRTQAPAPPPEPVPSSLPEPAASVLAAPALTPGHACPRVEDCCFGFQPAASSSHASPQSDKFCGTMHVFREGRWQQAYP